MKSGARPAAAPLVLGSGLVLLSTLALSTEAVLAKLAYAGGASISSVLLLRFSLSTLCFWLLQIRPPLGMPTSHLPWREGLKLLALGCAGQGVTVVLLFHSFRYISAAMAILFLYIYPAVSNLAAHFWLRETLTAKKILALVLALTGCLLILTAPGNPQLDNLAPAGLDWRGVAMALGAGIINGLFLVIGAKAVETVPVITFNAYVTTGVWITALVSGCLTGGLGLGFSAGAWASILAMTAFTATASLAMFAGVRYIGASATSIISTLEPAATALWAYLALGEIITPRQAWGGLVVLAGILFSLSRSGHPRQTLSNPGP